jgi:hypothetical protein
MENKKNVGLDHRPGSSDNEKISFNKQSFFFFAKPSSMNV